METTNTNMETTAVREKAWLQERCDETAEDIRSGLTLQFTINQLDEIEVWSAMGEHASVAIDDADAYTPIIVHVTEETLRSASPEATVQGFQMLLDGDNEWWGEVKTVPVTVPVTVHRDGAAQ